MFACRLETRLCHVIAQLYFGSITVILMHVSQSADWFSAASLFPSMKCLVDKLLQDFLAGARHALWPPPLKRCACCAADCGQRAT